MLVCAHGRDRQFCRACADKADRQVRAARRKELKLHREQDAWLAGLMSVDPEMELTSEQMEVARQVVARIGARQARKIESKTRREQARREAVRRKFRRGGRYITQDQTGRGGWWRA
jgi:hypothetical protein